MSRSIGAYADRGYGADLDSCCESTFAGAREFLYRLEVWQEFPWQTGLGRFALLVDRRWW